MKEQFGKSCTSKPCTISLKFEGFRNHIYKGMYFVFLTIAYEDRLLSRLRFSFLKFFFLFSFSFLFFSCLSQFCLLRICSLFFSVMRKSLGVRVIIIYYLARYCFIGFFLTVVHIILF